LLCKDMLTYAERYEYYYRIKTQIFHSLNPVVATSICSQSK
jgi:hypothetical protein